MMWLVFTCFLLWARHGEGGALKCLPEDDACSLQLSQEAQQEMEFRRSSELSLPECLSGSEWESNCHRCSCIDGEAQCLRQPACDSIEEPIRCKPNTTIARDCNLCRCLEDGLVCTLQECPSVTSETAPLKPIISKGVDCAPGTTWQSQCNDCVCSPEGRRHCTEKSCPGQETEPLLRCAPQSQWKNDCNMCWCNSGRAMCTKMGCLAIPSDMHFDDRKGDLEKKEIPEPNEFLEIPDLNSNDILYDATDKKIMSENLEDLDTTTDSIEDNLNEENLKKIENFDHNNIDIPIQIPDQVMTDFAANSDSNVRDEDLELLETLLNDKHQAKESSDNIKRVTDEQTEEPSHNSKDKDVEILGEAHESSDNSKVDDVELLEDADETSDDSKVNDVDMFNEDNTKGVKDVEILDEAYINQNSRKKRSACKPNEEFLNDCNTCKCSESGQSYTCTQNECMDREDGKEDPEDKRVDKEVEVFMESEGKDHVERHTVCKPSTTFYVGCNPCHCNSDGTDFTCPNKPCPLPEDVEVFHELHEMKPIVPYKGDNTKNKPTK